MIDFLFQVLNFTIKIVNFRINTGEINVSGGVIGGWAAGGTAERAAICAGRAASLLARERHAVCKVRQVVMVVMMNISHGWLRYRQRRRCTRPSIVAAIASAGIAVGAVQIVSRSTVTVCVGVRIGIAAAVAAVSAAIAIAPAVIMVRLSGSRSTCCSWQCPLCR